MGRRASAHQRHRCRKGPAAIFAPAKMLRCAPAFARLPLRGASLGPTAASYYNTDILTDGGLSRRPGGVQTDLHLESYQIKDIHNRDEDIPHGDSCCNGMPP